MPYTNAQRLFKAIHQNSEYIPKFLEWFVQDRFIAKLWEDGVNYPLDKERSFYWQHADRWHNQGYPEKRWSNEKQLFYQVARDLFTRHEPLAIHRKIKGRRPELLLFLLLKHGTEGVLWPLANQTLEHCPEWRWPSQLTESLKALEKCGAVEIIVRRGRQAEAIAPTNIGKRAAMLSLYPDTHPWFLPWGLETDSEQFSQQNFMDIVNFYDDIANKYRP